MTFKKQKQTIKKSVDDKYKRAVKRWGKTAQLSMIIEEASELGEACCRLIHRIMNLDKKTKNRNINMAIMLLEAEIADLEIMLEQAHYIFDDKHIKRIKREKLKKLDKLLRR